MKPVLPLFIFVDACGWEIIKDDPFVRDVAPFRRRLDTVFGYSSACVPSILSGRWPAEHRHWCFFVYDPVRSPFRSLRWLRWLPRLMTKRRRFRSWLSRRVKRRLGFRGYFDLYNIPFRYISLFDFTEKRSPLRPGGLNSGKNLADFLLEQRIPHFFADPERSEEENWRSLLGDISQETIDFAFLYWPDLDSLLHRVGHHGPEVSHKLRGYENWIRQLMTTAEKHYEEVRLYLFSDHGMANCDRSLDLRAQIDGLGLRMGRDYAVVYDSTMARFWFFNEQARQRIHRTLSDQPLGRILSDDELKKMGAFFEDRHFGETIFLVEEGVLIVPSHMGEAPLRGMHGYHPDAPHSRACLCSNQGQIPENVSNIRDMYGLMTVDAELARSRNSARRSESRQHLAAGGGGCREKQSSTPGSAE